MYDEVVVAQFTQEGSKSHELKAVLPDFRLGRHVLMVAACDTYGSDEQTYLTRDRIRLSGIRLLDTLWRRLELI